MSCGPGAGLIKLQLKLDAAKDKLDELTAGAEGIMGSINDLSAQLDEKIGEIGGSLKEMLPKIELPELPSLPELKLPEVPPLLKSLHTDALGILKDLNSKDPLKIAQAKLDIDKLKEKFPNMSDEEFAKLKENLLSGKIDIDNLCKLVPNLEVDSEGNEIEKGVPATAPEVDAEELKSAVLKVDLSALEEKAQNLEGTLAASIASLDLSATITDFEGQLDDALKAAKGSLAFDLTE